MNKTSHRKPPILPQAATPRKLADERITLLRGIQDRIAKAKIRLGETDFRVAQAEGDRQSARATLAEALRALETFANAEAEAMGLIKDGQWNFDIDHGQFTRT